MVEWKQFWKDIEDAFSEIKRITKSETLPTDFIEEAISAVAVFYKQNRETSKQTQFKGKSETGDAPTEKQLRYAKTLGITDAEAMTKQELSQAIAQKTGK